MKLLDTYLLREYRTPLLACFSTFCMLYIIYDLFDNLSDFVEAGTPLLPVLQYYVFLLPSVLWIIAPISLLLGTLFALAQLSRHHELIAMRACGMALRRLMIPFLAVGLFVSLAVAVIQETVAPMATEWTTQFLGEQKQRNRKVVQHLRYRNSEARRTWVIGRFDPTTSTLNNIMIVHERPDNSRESILTAREARWMDGSWWFFDLVTQPYTAEGIPDATQARTVEEFREMIDYPETPADFLSGQKRWELLSSLEMIRFLAADRGISEAERARRSTHLHHRLAAPWTCFIVTLFGIPVGARSGRQGALVGIFLALFCFFGFYAMIKIGLIAGAKQIIWAWMGGWLPNVVFLFVGLIMMSRMR